jgi:RecA/RadA recombinase
MSEANGNQREQVQQAKLAEISAYFIYGLQTGMIQPADVMSAFDDDPQPWNFFAEPDQSIIAHLIRNNGVGDPIAYLNALGDIGKKRVETINQNVMDVYIDGSRCVEWAAAIQEGWQQREGLSELRRGMIEIQKPGADATQILNAIAAKLSQIGQRVRKGTLTGGADAERKSLERLDSIAGIGKDIYILTGINAIDDGYGGVERGKLTALGGVWGSGKTALAAQMSYYMARNGQVGLWIQTEMDEADLINREAQRIQRVKRYDLTQLHNKLREARTLLKRGHIDPSQVQAIERQIEAAKKAVLDNSAYQRLRAEIPKISSLPIRYFLTPNQNALQIQTLMQAVLSEFGRLDWLIVDHVEYLQPVHKAPDSEKVKQIYADFKIVMREFPNTAYMFLQHLNKEIFSAAKTNKSIVPSMSNFNYGGTGALDNGWIIARPSQHMQQLNISEETMAAKSEEEREKFEREAYLWIVKSRAGKSNVAIPFQYVGEYYNWREV